MARIHQEATFICSDEEQRFEEEDSKEGPSSLDLLLCIMTQVVLHVFCICKKQKFTQCLTLCTKGLCREECVAVRVNPGAPLKKRHL